MFHLQISRLRELLQQHLIREYGGEIAPGGRLLPGIEEALASLGSRYQIPVSVPIPITASVMKEQPLKLSIGLEPESAHGLRQAGPRISIWGVMAVDHGPDAGRTLQPLMIEIVSPGAAPCDQRICGALNLLRQPALSRASLAPQVAEHAPEGERAAC